MCACDATRDTHNYVCDATRDTHNPKTHIHDKHGMCIWAAFQTCIYTHTSITEQQECPHHTPGPGAGGDIGFFDLVKQRNNPRSGNVGEDSNIHEPVVYLTASKPGQFQSFLRRPALVCRHMLALTSQGGTHKQNTHINRERERETHTHTHTHTLSGCAGRILRPWRRE